MTLIWHRGTGHASFNLQVNDGQADLQLSFKLGKPDDPHLPLPSKKTRGKGEKQRERDRARAAAHHAKLAAASAVQASEQPVETLEASTEATLGSPALTAPLPLSDSGGCRRPSTRSTSVLVKMKMAAFARSAAESALKETLPEFIPGFDETIEYFRKECDFGDEEEKRFFSKYTDMYVFGFRLEQERVTTELLESIKCEWTKRDRYWDGRPSEVIDISIN